MSGEFRRIRALYYGMICRDRRAARPVWAAAQIGQRMGRYDHRPDLRPCRDDGRPFHARQRRLLRRKLSFPADRSRPAPAISAGRRVDRFTEAVDVMPTLLDLLGQDPPAYLDGASLDAVPRKETPPDWRDVGALGVRLPGRSQKARRDQHFGLKPQQCNLAVFRTRRIQIRAFRWRAAAAFVRSARRSGRVAQPAPPILLTSRSARNFAERMLAWRAEHLDQSLALISTDRIRRGGQPAPPCRCV